MREITLDCLEETQGCTDWMRCRADRWQAGDAGIPPAEAQARAPHPRACHLAGPDQHNCGRAAMHGNGDTQHGCQDRGAG